MSFEIYDLDCPCGEHQRCYAIDDKGWGKCFSCGKNFKEGTHASSPKDEVHMDKRDRSGKVDRKKYKFQYAPVLGFDQDVLEFFDCKVGIAEDTNEPEVLTHPHPNGRILWRFLKEKDFRWHGEKLSDQGCLFGLDKFPPGGKAITIVEGAKDALAVYQMFGKKYPVVAVTSAQQAKNECAQEYEYLNSFDKIYLCFDSDEAGQTAADKVARLFDFNKVYLVSMTKKDPYEYFASKSSQEFVSTWWNAKRFLPEGILSSFSEFDTIIDEDIEKPSVPYPFQTLQEMTYGIRSGEMVLLTAQEGIGKTEILRAIEYHLLKTTKEKIGIIHLEENKARTLKGLVGYEMQRPIHLPVFAIPKEEIKAGLRKVIGEDERVHIYSHFGSDDPDVILSTIRFLAGSCGCKYIFLDHITMVVTGLAGDDERRALDYISTRLAMMVEELDFTLFLISHINDEGQTRGSRNIGKVADLRIDMHRDIKEENERKRNTTSLMVSKNRYAGKTGPGGFLYFDPDTYTLTEVDADGEQLPF